MKSLQEMAKAYKKMTKQRDEARAENERLKAQMADFDQRFGDYAFHKGYVSPEDAKVLRDEAAALRAKWETVDAAYKKLMSEAPVEQLSAAWANAALLTSEVDTYKRVAEANLAVAEKASQALDETKAELVKLQASSKVEELKDLRKRLHAKTERVKEVEVLLHEAQRLINQLLRLPAVREVFAEAASAHAAEVKAESSPTEGDLPAPSAETIRQEVANGR